MNTAERFYQSCDLFYHSWRKILPFVAKHVYHIEPFVHNSFEHSCSNILCYRRFFILIQYRKILEMHSEGASLRRIAASTGHSRQKITETIKIATERKITLPPTEQMDDKWLEGFLFPEKLPESKGRHLPDFESIHQELAKPNVTLSLLHYEYETFCRANNKLPYAYRTFCQYYTEYAQKHKATLRIKRKPGEILEVDWAGSTLSVFDSITGEEIKAYVFVATLPCTQLSYAEAFFSMESASWVTAHNNAFQYFGGTPKILVPDNLKVGVIHNRKDDIKLNRTYQELADHYGCIVIPTRVSSPKDKASVEGNVGVISTWIIAALRNFQCFSLEELNEEIKNKLTEFNEKPFTKKSGSRLSSFLEEEKFALGTLPAHSYKIANWKQAKVQFDYHVPVDDMFYSVPYEYIKKEVDIRVGQEIVEVFYNNMRIASHKRLTGRKGQFATIDDHMPDKHRMYVGHTPDSSREWAESLSFYIESRQLFSDI